jgi:protease YdgD
MIRFTSEGDPFASKARYGLISSLTIVGSLLFLAVPVLSLESHREIVDVNLHPWSSVGKVSAAGLQCTGVVIGPNQFLTAAHCLYSERTSRFLAAGSIHFLLGYARGQYSVHRIASEYTVSPTFDPTKSNRLPLAYADDWAVLYVSEPFPSHIKALPLASAEPSPGEAVKSVGYAQDRLHMMTADQRCRIKFASGEGKLIAHDCVIQRGDSGGALLTGDRSDKGLIVGINVGLPKDLTQSRQRGGVAISAASIQSSLRRAMVEACVTHMAPPSGLRGFGTCANRLRL